jgi:hypothetical protein
MHVARENAACTFRYRNIFCVQHSRVRVDPRKRIRYACPGGAGMGPVLAHLAGIVFKLFGCSSARPEAERQAPRAQATKLLAPPPAMVSSAGALTPFSPWRPRFREAWSPGVLRGSPGREVDGRP